MDHSRWEKIKDAYAQASGLAETEADRFVDSLPSDIRPDIAKLIAADREADGFLEGPAFIDPGIESKSEPGSSPTPEIEGYKILQPIGTGGMGTVYAAERRGEGFTQTVAVKVIKRGMDTHAVLKRFLTERRILADLEHPNIARMLDGGSTKDGVPYFVMEHVIGEPLRAFCDKRNLDIPSRLRIFSKVCSAVNHAHQKLVVHRDIKPSNILVTEQGEPKLLDFGIAKLLNPDRATSDGAATATNFRVMTPEYASPEQLRGEPTTTLTDVYSLGVVLYELLTGVRPFQAEGGNPLKIAQAMTSREPLKPSIAAGSSHRGLTSADDKATAANVAHYTGEAPVKGITHTAAPDAKTLRGDLDNIVMMAIRREKERRYQSVQELLDDVERYLSGLPVRATEDSIRYRVTKFVGRHKAGVSAAAVVAVALFASSVVTGYQYRQASIERARAEARFAEGRKFANAVIHAHYERIKDLPGSTEAKAGLIADAVAYLDSVSKEATGDPAFQRELAKAYLKLSEIQGLTMGSGDLGDRAAARDSVGKAIALLEQLVEVDRNSVEDRRSLAQSYSNLSYIVPVSERTAHADRSFEIFRSLLEINPDKEQANSDYARALWDRANRVREGGDNRTAIAHFSEAAAIYERLYDNGAGNKRFRRSASLTYKNLGSVHRVSGDPSAALACYEKALAYDIQINAESPDNQDAILALSFSRRGLGEAFVDLKDYGRALAEYEQAIAIQEKALAADGKNAFLADALTESYTGAGVACRERADYQKAESHFRKAFALARTIPRDESDNLWRLYLAKTHLEYGEMLMRKGEAKGRAREELRAALVMFDEVNAEGALDPAMAPHHERTKALLARL